MKILAYLAFAFATTTVASSEHYGHAHLHKRLPAPAPPQNASEQHVIITGVKGPHPPVARLEINDLLLDHDKWNIFLLALYRWKAADSSNPLSFTRVAGIHGRPFTMWNGVPQGAGCRKTGYCNHHVNTFGHWHIALCATVDQALRFFAMEAANEFTGADRAKYVAAAQDLVMPRWDFARPMRQGEFPFPAFFTAIDAAVYTPDGPVNILNPLRLFNFTRMDLPHAWIKDPAAGTTIRKPYRITAQWRRNIRSTVWSVLTHSQDFNHFICQALDSAAQKTLNPYSLESAHNQPHGGAGGDMNVLENSMFDPLFCLIHTNVDWLLHLYMAANPTAQIQPHAATGDSFTYKKGTIRGGDSPLHPFRKDDQGNFWTPNDLHGTTVFGYYYPGIGTQQDAIATISKYYRDAGSSTGPKKRGLLDQFTHSFLPELDNLTTEIEQAISGILEPYSSGTNGKTVDEYTVVVQADSMAEEGSFVIFLFDGTPDTDPTKWAEQTDALLGWHNFFTSEESMDGSPSIGGVSITDALLDRVVTRKLKGMDDATVKQYLTTHLQIRALRDAREEEIPTAEVQGLKLTLQHNSVTMPTSHDNLPEWSIGKSLRQFI